MLSIIDIIEWLHRAIVCILLGIPALTVLQYLKLTILCHMENMIWSNGERNDCNNVN